MPSTEIAYQAEAGRTIYDYRPRLALFTPQVWLWCVIGGAPVGIAGAIAHALLDLGGNVSFTGVLVGLTALSALVLYVFMRIITRSRVVLSVTIDVLAGRLEIYRRHPRPTTRRYALLDVHGFHAESAADGWQQSCTLVMQLGSGKAIPLLEIDRKCYPRNGLSDLAERLSVALAASQDEIISAPPRFAHNPVYAPPSEARPAVPPRQRVVRPVFSDEDDDDERD